MVDVHDCNFLNLKGICSPVIIKTEFFADKQMLFRAWALFLMVAINVKLNNYIVLVLHILFCLLVCLWKGYVPDREMTLGK